MPAPSIISAQTFLTNTKLGIFNGRKSLEAIDGLLTQCSALDAKTTQQRIDLMALLIEECSKWIKAKAALTDENTLKRRPPVEALLLQAQKRFAYERFTQKKERARAMGRPLLTKGLQSGYLPERVQFMTQRADLRARDAYGRDVTINPIGGSYAHEMHDIARRPVVPTTSADMRQVAAVARPGGFATFTVADYEAYKATGHSFTQAPFVHYMRKSERLNKMLVVSNGFLMHKGAKFDSGIQTNIYVMDTYGNLFFQNAQMSGRMVGFEASQFNHSSINAGNEVICAGVIVVEAGVLKSISNESGHYAPSHMNLKECLDMLVSDGLDISSTMVSILTAAPESPFGPWRADLFLSNPDACLVPVPVPRRRGEAMINGPRPLVVP